MSNKNKLFVDSIEMIACLQFKTDEAIHDLSRLKESIAARKLHLRSKEYLIAMVEDMKPEIAEELQARISAIRAILKKNCY
ncbi:hypothetical protein SAMN06265348_110271 [Pedobacter westerhofensis]|uniref:Uncharacterized protein n=1 Tax=Pedobacter westerhofensis TaxID=425512 RepID=A0A521F7X6_9SPHI|nr:hypothetical protein [Pedobacter westerhofensis]SMO92289.1 hypothetical protein SAMN06265348_110271 [Pedobacter westerhofensis]